MENKFKYFTEKDKFLSFLNTITSDKTTKDLLERYKRWSLSEETVMRGNKYSLKFEYNVIGVFPYVYLFPIVSIYDNNSFPIRSFYQDLQYPFDTNFLKNVGKEYSLDFLQYKGKGMNKKPIHKVILRKIPNIEFSYFYLKEYTSPDDILLSSVNELKSPNYHYLFKNLKSPIFYMSRYSEIDYGNWVFSIDSNLSEINNIPMNEVNKLLDNFNINDFVL